MQQKDSSFAMDAVAAAALMAVNDGVMPMGMIKAQLVDKDNNPVGEPKIFRNLVVTTGLTYFASRGVGTAAAAIGWIAIGSGTTAVSAGQTALVTETARVAVSSSTNTGAVITVVATVPAGTGTGTVEEVGIFNAASVGTMVARALTGTITKPAGLGLQFTWTITFS